MAKQTFIQVETTLQKNYIYASYITYCGACLYQTQHTLYKYINETEMPGIQPKVQNATGIQDLQATEIQQANTTKVNLSDTQAYKQ